MGQCFFICILKALSQYNHSIKNKDRGYGAMFFHLKMLYSMQYVVDSLQVDKNL